MQVEFYVLLIHVTVMTFFGIKVDDEEIKVSLFADDLTVFLKDDLSPQTFLNLQKIMELALV